jgi:hypothetical protein
VKVTYSRCFAPSPSKIPGLVSSSHPHHRISICNVVQQDPAMALLSHETRARSVDTRQSSYAIANQRSLPWHGANVNKSDSNMPTSRAWAQTCRRIRHEATFLPFTSGISKGSILEMDHFMQNRAHAHLVTTIQIKYIWVIATRGEEPDRSDLKLSSDLLELIAISRGSKVLKGGHPLYALVGRVCAASRRCLLVESKGTVQCERDCRALGGRDGTRRCVS